MSQIHLIKMSRVMIELYNLISMSQHDPTREHKLPPLMVAVMTQEKTLTISALLPQND
jgi:hypothetical protein